MLNQVVQFFVGLVNDRCKTKYLLKCTFLLKGRFRVFLKFPAPSFFWLKNSLGPVLLTIFCSLMHLVVERGDGLRDTNISITFFLPILALTLCLPIVGRCYYHFTLDGDARSRKFYGVWLHFQPTTLCREKKPSQ